MNDFVKYGLSAIGGAGLGVLACYLYLNKIKNTIEDKEFAIYRDELTKLRAKNESLEAYIKRMGSEDESYKNAVVLDNEMMPDPTPITCIQDESEEDEDEDDDVEIEEDSFDIRFISPADYEDDEDYEKEVLKYYKDGVVTQDDEILELYEVEDQVGDKALKSFGMYGATRNEVYVRNEHWKTDYKIKKYNLSYEQYRNSKDNDNY